MTRRESLRRFLALLMPVLAFAQEGLYISNSTDILYHDGDTNSVQSVYHDPNARIVGLGIDIDQSKIFWTDISLVSRGIYAADLGGSSLSSVTRIVSNDVGESNGLAVDWVSKHIYWTDTSKKSIEVAEYDGTNRRVLTIDGLETPRGIVADPNNGWLFWNDQGTKTIERSRLDGSGRQTIVGDGLTWPNHMTIMNDKLYYVDGNTKKLSSCNKDGADRNLVQRLNGNSADNPVFGLTNDGTNNLYISLWHQGKVLKYVGGVVSDFVDSLGTEPLFGLAYYVDGLQPITATNQPCMNGATSGCSHLCLPITATTRRCSCPSFGGKTLSSNGLDCNTPTNVMFYVLAGQGIVGYTDMDGASTPDRYLVGRSLRPVAVAYDPVDQFVYWSDVHESTVHKAHFTGASHTIFMSSSSHSIGVVDGLMVDPLHRKLYYTNMGQVDVYSNTHAWHKIELIGLDGQGRKTVVENVEKPRGLHLDYDGGYLYYTDWGSKPALVKTDLDGSNAVVLKVGLDNPNAVTVLNSDVYVVDSHYKTGSNSNYPGDAMLGGLYRLSGNSWSKIADLDTPFGMTVIGNELYISDWTLGLVRITTPAGNNPSRILQNSDIVPAGATPMDMFYSAVSATLGTNQDCVSASCAEICLTEPGSGHTCTCDTYTHHISSGAGDCQAPTDFMLICDYNSIKMIGLDAQTFQYADDKMEPQVVVEGNSYFSNYVAMAKDQHSDTIYFTDVNRGAIYSVVLGEEPELFFDTGHVVDGLGIDTVDDWLFWTAITNPDTGRGIIAAMKTNGDPTTYGTVVPNLNRPRAIRVDSSNSEIYWTEWGSTPQVRKTRYTTGGRAVGSNVEILLDDAAVSRPNGLDIDVSGDKLYVGEREGTIKRCTLAGRNCETLAFVGEGPQHIFSVKYASPGQLLFSDWHRNTVSLFDIESGYIVDVATDLMRPTEILLQPPVISAVSCPNSAECSGDAQCVSYPGGYFCKCEAGQVLSSDGTMCIDNDVWVPLPIELCGSCAGSNKVCAAQVGSSAHACHCDAGYYLDGNRCTACVAGKYKAYAGDGSCAPCPAGSDNTGTGNTVCTCSNNAHAWNWQTATCEQNKPGDCPNVNVMPCADGGCTNDGACPDAQRCCSAGCSSNQCVDPVNISQGQCVYDGIIYQVGSSFEPYDCVSCTCTMDKTLGDPSYGMAECATTDCPVVSCDTDLVFATGQCCPVCGNCATQPIRITNCPTEAMTVTLPADGHSTTVNYIATHVDNCGYFSRATYSPAGDLMVAYGEDRVTVTVGASSDDDPSVYEEDVCVIQVNVQDNTAPVPTCPADTIITIGSNAAQVAVTPPQITDNVCGVQKSGVDDHYDGCTYELNGAPNRWNSEGVYPLTYVVRDVAGNTGECSFTYTIQRNEQLSCEVPSVNNGAFSCDGTARVTCMLQCNTGYDTTLVTAFDSVCRDDEWDPPFANNIQQLGCTRAESHKVLTSLRLVGLPCPVYSREVVALGLEETIRDEHLPDVHGSEVSVRTDGCEHGDEDDFEITIWLSVEYSGGEQDTQSEILTQLASDIQQAIQDGYIGLPDTPGDQPTIAPPEPPVPGCLRGEKNTGTQCVRCPSGTRWEGIVFGDNDCEPCAKNTYQDQEKKDFCKKCPDQYATDERGASSQDQCMEPPTGPPDEKNGGNNGDGEFPAAIVGGAVGALVLLIVIVVIAVVVIKKRGSNREERCGDADTHHVHNPAFDESRNSGIYEEMPADVVGYETLNETKKDGLTNAYDKVGIPREVSVN